MEDNARVCTQVSIVSTLCDQELVLHVLRSSDCSFLSRSVLSIVSVPRIRIMDSSGLFECRDECSEVLPFTSILVTRLRAQS